MKKNIKLITFITMIFIGVILFGKNVYAYGVEWTDKGVVPGSSPSIRKYKTYVGNSMYMTYCLDPGRPNGILESAGWIRDIPPQSLNPADYPVGTTMYKFSLAVQYIYQTLQENGWDDESDMAYTVGTTAFRIAAFELYNWGNDAANKTAYQAYAGYGAGLGKIAGIDEGISIAKSAIQFANNYGNSDYYQLINDGLIPGITWSTASYEIKQIDGSSNYELTVEIIPSREELDISKLDISFLNPTVILKDFDVTPSVNKNLKITAYFDGSGWNQQDVQLYVDAYYCDPISAASMLYLLSGTQDLQRFIVVLPGSSATCNYTPTSPNHSKSKIPTGGGGDISKNSCSCDRRDGVYTYIKEKNGVETDRYTWKAGEEPPTGIDVSTCPPTSECEKDIPDDDSDELCICEDPSTRLYLYKKYENDRLVDTKTWLGTDPGSKAWEQEYNCPPCGDTSENKCKKSNASSTGYFCSDGKECSEEIFLKDPREDSRGCGDIICTKSDASSTGYFCRDGSECSEEIFKKHPDENAIGCGDKYPSHTCEKPSDSNGNKWYCNDGNECNEQDYYKDCECDSLPPESEEYKKFCLNCNPTITVPGGCKNLSDDDPSKGTMGDINTVSTECNTDVDQIKYCVLGKDDLLGNTFEATEELKDNPYCKVWCKEDYDFKLPTAKLTQSGGYFTLATTLNGKRSCYTSSASDPTKEIDSVKFEEDLKAAQNAVIDAFNDYNYFKAAANANVSKKTISDTGKCPYDCSEDGKSKTCYNDGASGSVTEISLSWSAVQYNHDGTTYTKSGSFSDGDINCGCESCDKHEGHDRRTDEGWHGSGGTEHTSDDSAKYNTDLNKYDNKDNRFPTLDIYDPRNPTRPTTPNNRDDSDESKSYTRLMEEKKAILVEKVNALNNIISQYNSCSGVVLNSKTSSVATVDASSTTTTSWENTMLWGTSDEYSPIIDFVYNEDYLNNMNGQFTEVSGNMKTDKNEFCAGEINDKYECTVASTNDIVTKDKSYITCDEEGCKTVSSKISTAKWVTKTKERTATYQIDKSFSTSTPYGVVKFQSEACSGNDCLWSRLPEGALPVQLNRNTGLFPFKFTFRNIGQFNNANTTGRIIGKNTNDASVITEYNKLPESEKCTKENVSPTTDGSYVCYYLNNCDDCDFECDPDDPNHCEFGCNGDSCDMVCDNCIFDGGEAVYSYRTVSLNSLFPNERKVGSNWNIENQKAQITQNAIDELGEEIYTTPQYSYTLTPGNLKEIREYNDDAGSYVNSKFAGKENGESGKDALYCETKTFNGIEYKINCRSRFLDMLENEKGYATVNSRITSNNSNYNKIVGDPFELYTDAVENCEDGECLTIGIGPSWRIRSGN